MTESEKNFLERVADKIPGLKGYRARESRRDTDKRLREHIAAALDQQRRGMESTKRDLLAAARLDVLGSVDRVASKFQRAADSIRFATYGFSGFFDQVKIREAELDELYAYDAELLGAVRDLDGKVKSAGKGQDPGGSVRELESAVDGLIITIEGRKGLFNRPAGASAAE